MYEPRAVGHTEAAEHRSQHGGHGVRWHRAALAQKFPQRAAVDQFHHQERVAYIGALVIDGDETGILEPGDGAGLTRKAGQELLIAGVAGIHHLQGHGTVEPQI